MRFILTVLLILLGSAPAHAQFGETFTSESFLGLKDTPDSYTGESGKCVAVNGTELGLEFAVCGSGGDSITVNGSAATNANFLDNIYFDFSLDTSATPDDITIKPNYNAASGNIALAANEVAFSLNGLVSEGATANDVEGRFAFPDWSSSDKDITFQDATHTVVGRDTTDTLTNKTLAAANNVIGADTAEAMSGSGQIDDDDLAAAAVDGGTGGEIADNSLTPADIDETQDFSYATLSGKQDRNNTAVSDDDCSGEQGLWWYDTTDSAFEFCNSNTGTPSTLGGGSGSPGGSDTQVQFNDGGTFGGDAGLTYDKTNDILQVGENGLDGVFRIYNESGATDYQTSFSPGGNASASNTVSHPVTVGGMQTIVIDRDVTPTAFNTSAAENTIYTYTIPANSLDSNSCLRLTLGGTYLNNTGVNTPDMTVRYKLGASTVFTTSFTNITNSANRRPVSVVWNICNQGATNDQSHIIREWDVRDANMDVSAGSSAIDMTSDQAITITAQHDASNANQEVAQEDAFLELMQ